MTTTKLSAAMPTAGIAEIKDPKLDIDSITPPNGDWGTRYSPFESTWETLNRELNRELNNMFVSISRMVGKPKYSDGRTVLETNGLKGIINRPHNLYIERDEKGAITKYMLKIVYTPFPKSDVHVEVQNDALVITIGKENLPEEKNCIYCNISRQCEKIMFYLTDRNIDAEKITAKRDDGILSIEIPVKPRQQPRTIEIV